MKLTYLTIVLILSAIVFATIGRSVVASSGKHSAFIKIVTNEGYCSGVVINDTTAYTARHCVIGGKPEDGTKSFRVFNSEGAETGIIAETQAYSYFLDYAKIKGDFSSFQHMSAEVVRNGLYDSLNKSLKFCGYPLDAEVVQCDTFKPIGVSTFTMTGEAYVAPGFSGSPVFDPDTNKVYGVVSGVDDLGRVYIAPLIGIERLQDL